MDTPTNVQTRFFIEGEDSIRVTVLVGYLLSDGTMVAKDDVYDGERFIQALDLIKSRGAKRGDDFIITTHAVGRKGILLCSIHTTHDFLHNEDFDL